MIYKKLMFRFYAGWHQWPLWVHVFSWGTLICLTVALVGITNVVGHNVWNGWRESSGLRHPTYTEQVFIENVIRTRANTWSNLAYILVGLYSLALGWHDLKQSPSNRSGYLIQTPALSLTFGVACCYLGIGSGLFHASLTRVGQQIDVAAMYTPLLTLCVVNIGREIPAAWHVRLRPFPIWILLIALVAAASWLLFVYKWSMSSLIVLSSLIAVIGVSLIADQFQTLRRLDLRWGAMSLAMLVAAVACRELDIAKRFSHPTAWIQGHAMWHVLTSLSLACIYCYYRSEINSSSKGISDGL